MNKKYITPIMGKIYQNRNDREYRCVDVMTYGDAALDREVMLKGDLTATMERITDGWTLTAHGVQEYEDGTIEWNYSTGGHFTR